jgi:hypothetical protein
VSEDADTPQGRAAALERLREGLSSLADLGERLDAAGDDRERKEVLLVMITAAWTVRDRAADAYAALDWGGLAKEALG